MKTASLLVSLLILLLAAVAGAEDAARERDMNAAVAQARGDIGHFIAALEKGRGPAFIKVNLSDGANTEDFWLSLVRFRDGGFIGEVSNRQEKVQTITPGQVVNVRKEEVVDWFYLQEGRVIGNYTLQAALRYLPEREAASLRRQAGWD